MLVLVTLALLVAPLGVASLAPTAAATCAWTGDPVQDVQCSLPCVDGEPTDPKSLRLCAR